MNITAGRFYSDSSGRRNMNMEEKEIKKQNPLIEDTHPDVLYQDACTIIDQAQVAAYRAVNETLIKRNWLLGMRIQHEVLKDKNRRDR